ncbi:MAG: UDP-glucose 4-epimerase GalE [Zymomonas mobilis]|uniref:UDP-glucose 4-epimerase n=1 Tax=Zymomonas mobilis TaxID=542 RepID=A0A542VZB9_ZYMMB|nr:UDP-glucose 4-epimerase GalE [Zymomonas mobilis]TQL16649.1 UDP-glucose 4-epimerase [Zymomonas mobilis]
MRYLVTGGAGFVGSHVVLALLDSGHEVTVIDDLSTGHRAAIPTGVPFYQIDLNNYEATYEIVAREHWDGVLHFAALSVVGDSIKNPFHYLRHNYCIAVNLIQACAENGVKKIVFSSTAALFGGNTQTTPIHEATEIHPGSPYGESKFIIERVLHWADTLYGLHSARLRYFNAAGADMLGRAGEDHRPETHLIPLTIDAALGRRPALELFGTDYPTKDGTCIRDYVHVMDLADAHIRVLEQLDRRSVTYNIGNGRGYSNMEVIESVERASGKKIPWNPAARRKGDPAILVADSTTLRKETGWQPQYSKLDDIIESALNWRIRHPDGYSM